MPQGVGTYRGGGMSKSEIQRRDSNNILRKNAKIHEAKERIRAENEQASRERDELAKRQAQCLKNLFTMKEDVPLIKDFQRHFRRYSKTLSGICSYKALDEDVWFWFLTEYTLDGLSQSQSTTTADIRKVLIDRLGDLRDRFDIELKIVIQVVQQLKQALVFEDNTDNKGLFDFLRSRPNQLEKGISTDQESPPNSDWPNFLALSKEDTAKLASKMDDSVEKLGKIAGRAAEKRLKRQAKHLNFSANVGVALWKLDAEMNELEEDLEGWDPMPFEDDDGVSEMQWGSTGQDRTRVPQSSFAAGGEYRGVCKLFLRFGTKAYIGTGWLVDKDTIATAGHCVFSKVSGHLNGVTVVFGYHGKQSQHSLDTEMQHGSHVALHWGWYDANRKKNDIALIRLSAPVRTIKPFLYENTPEQGSSLLRVVGYPFDKGGPSDRGGYMYMSEGNTTWVLDDEDAMLKYTMDTAGGNSGGPVFRVNTQERTLTVIATHCNGFPEKQCNRGSILGRSGNMIAFFREALSIYSGRGKGTNYETHVINGGPHGSIHMRFHLEIQKFLEEKWPPGQDEVSAQPRPLALTDTKESYRQSATAFRNTIYLAQEQRDGFISATNERARSMDAQRYSFESSS
ncbi:hypothetical protein V492_04655 [Pseudogymnoascus sp. VKM F-4246]|nr:hypothetical protein V492_04655 [Pseudogymnoascus sp. VKM F-4246]